MHRRFVSSTIFILVLLLIHQHVFAQNELNDYNAQLFTTPLQYTAAHVTNKLVIDGKLNEAEWQHAQWSANFQDIEGAVKSVPPLYTKMKMLWDDSTLYIGAALQEPQLSATLTRHDGIIFHDNDFEIFIDPDNDTHNYFEIEINALNTIFDLFLPKPYRDQSDALIGYDVAGLTSAVHLNGSLNKPTDKDSDWTIEIAVPLKSVNFGVNRSFIPHEGDFYRINFSRVEWEMNVVNGTYVKTKDSAGHLIPEHNWSWSPQGLIAMHYPERWGYVFFSQKDTTYTLPAAEEAKQYLWLIYYKQKDYFHQHQKYAASLKELHIADSFQLHNNTYQLLMEATTRQFSVALTSSALQSTWIIYDDGLIKQNKK